MSVPEKEVLITKKLLGGIDSNKRLSKRTRRYLRIFCPVCNIKLKLNDRCIRLNTAKYCHVKCFPFFRFDSEISDEELDNEMDSFFSSNPYKSNKELGIKKNSIPH
jgi:hypothetical protein